MKRSNIVKIQRIRGLAVRRRAMKRWLRARNVSYSAYEGGSASALRKKIRSASLTQSRLEAYRMASGTRQ